MLSSRHKLPWAIAAVWLWGSWYWILDAPSLQRILTTGFIYDQAERFSEFEAVAWFVLLLATMWAADWLLCRYADWRWGVDPMTLHWSLVRNREGNFVCAACLSPFMLPPGDLDEANWVHCGDCGHPVARYGDMKPYLDPAGELAKLARRALQ